MEATTFLCSYNYTYIVSVIFAGNIGKLSSKFQYSVKQFIKLIQIYRMATVLKQIDTFHRRQSVL